jgi:hypothetical protein
MASSLFFLLLGFASGNICPTAFGLFSKFVPWNGLFVLFLVMLAEQKKPRKAHFFHLGFLFGLFVDAFKVGS